MADRREKTTDKRSGDEAGGADSRDVHFSQIIGRELLRDPDCPAWNDARFVAWYAAEMRERNRRLARRTDAEVARDTAALMLRVEARQLKVRRLTASARTRRPAIPGCPSEVLEPANSSGAMPLVDLAVAAGVGRELWDEPVEEWAEIPPDLPPGKYIALRIAGQSMAPLMHTGDTIAVRIGGRVAPGTVIVARHPDNGYVCKIVRRMSPAEIELGSFAPGNAAFVIPNDPRLIVGTVKIVWCHHPAPDRINGEMRP
jgi:SOS-response transcriptional repressor LexA